MNPTLTFWTILFFLNSSLSFNGVYSFSDEIRQIGSVCKEFLIPAVFSLYTFLPFERHFTDSHSLTCNFLYITSQLLHAVASNVIVKLACHEESR